MEQYIRAFLIAAIASFAFGCGVSAQSGSSPKTDQDRYRSAADYSRDHNGLSVLVMKGDKIVFEDYGNGHTADQAWLLASGTKSFTGVMLAAAIEDKLVSGFDEKVSDTIAEWRSDKRKAQITLRQLLSLTSGIDAGKIGVVPTYSEAVSNESRYDPGSHFEYGPAPFQVFGEVMTRKLRTKGETVEKYLHRRIIDPIGMKVTFWRADFGQPMLPQGANLTAREWVKFGQFLKNGGKWNGKQIIAKNLLDQLVVGSSTNPAYGISFWLNHAGRGPSGRSTGRGAMDEIANAGISDGVSDLYMAAGAANQRLYIIPSLDMVVVRQGRLGEYSDRDFLKRLLFGTE